MDPIEGLVDILITFVAQYQTELGILGSVSVAMLLGAVIGFERELENKPAGLRTHMLVSGASTLLVALSDVTVTKSNITLANNLVQSDPIRIIEAVITGVSFLGAGTIIRHRGKRRIEGLTTAASILFAAGVGVCVALAQWVLALGITLLVLTTLRGLGALEDRANQHLNDENNE